MVQNERKCAVRQVSCRRLTVTAKTPTTFLPHAKCFKESRLLGSDQHNGFLYPPAHGPCIEVTVCSWRFKLCQPTSAFLYHSLFKTCMCRSLRNITRYKYWLWETFPFWLNFLSIYFRNISHIIFVLVYILSEFFFFWMTKASRVNNRRHFNFSAKQNFTWIPLSFKIHFFL
jgi:hypothetical protein